MIKNINNNLKKNIKINIQLRLIRYSLKLLLSILTIIDFLYKEHQLKYHDLYKSLKIIILFITTILLLVFLDNLNNIHKIFIKKKQLNIYEKYHLLLKTYIKKKLKKNGIINA